MWTISYLLSTQHSNYFIHAGGYSLNDYIGGIGIDASKVVDSKHIKSFLQGGYATVYNTQTKIPLYTLERLNGLELEKASYFEIFLVTSTHI